VKYTQGLYGYEEVNSEGRSLYEQGIRNIVVPLVFVYSQNKIFHSSASERPKKIWSRRNNNGCYLFPCSSLMFIFVLQLQLVCV
jgi:hypothetical protein